MRLFKKGDRVIGIRGSDHLYPKFWDVPGTVSEDQLYEGDCATVRVTIDWPADSGGSRDFNYSACALRLYDGDLPEDL